MGSLLLQGRVSHALEDVLQKLPCLEGLAQVCASIPASKAELLLEHVQQHMGQMHMHTIC